MTLKQTFLVVILIEVKNLVRRRNGAPSLRVIFLTQVSPTGKNWLRPRGKIHYGKIRPGVTPNFIAGLNHDS